MVSGKLGYLNALEQADAYPELVKEIKLTETQGSYLIQADQQFYKIKKTGNEFASLAIKEAFCFEECHLLRRYNPDWQVEVETLMQKDSKYRLGGNQGEVVEYALKLETLTVRRFLSSLMDSKKINKADLSLVAQHLAVVHAQSGVSVRDGETGKAESFQALCDDILYQMKRYFEVSVTQPIIDMVRHPLDKFIQSKSKLFAKRLRKGLVVQGHGALLPEHVHVQGETVRLISPQEVYKKYSVLDVANDLATMMVQLYIQSFSEIAEHFLKKYQEVSRDKDLTTILPAYLTYCALKHGVRTCEEKVASKDESLGSVALEYFNLATRFSRLIPKD